MRLKETHQDGIDVFHLEGEVDLHFAPSLRSLLQAKIRAKSRSLVLDFTKVTHIDSTGISTIIEYYRDAARHGGLLCLCCLNEDLQTIFHIVKLDQAIPIFTTLAATVTAIRNGNIHAPAEALFHRA